MILIVLLGAVISAVVFTHRTDSIYACLGCTDDFYITRILDIRTGKTFAYDLFLFKASSVRWCLDLAR